MVQHNDILRALDDIEELVSSDRIEQASQAIITLEEEINILDIDKKAYFIRLDLLKAKLLNRQGKYNDALTIIEEILPEASKSNDHLLLLEILKEKARITLTQASYAKMHKTLEQITQHIKNNISELPEVEYHRTNFFITNIQGLYCWRTGDFKKAIESFRHLLDKAQQEESLKSYLSTACNNLGLVYYEVGNFQQSLYYLQQALAYYDQSKSEELASSKTLNNIGFVYKALGDYNQALEYFKRAYEIRLRLGSKNEVTRVLDNIGEIYMLQGKYKEAEEIFHQCLSNAKEISDYEELAWVYDLLGQLYRRKGEYRQALNYYNLSMQFNKDLKHELAIAKNLMLISEIYLEQGEIQLALECVEQSLEFFNKIKNNLRIAEAKYYLAKIVFELKEYKKTEQLLKDSLKLFNEVGNYSKSAKVLFELMCFYLWSGKLDIASNTLNNLQEIIKKTKNQNQTSALYLLAKSILLRNNQRLTTKAKAQEQLYNLENSEVITLDHSLYIIVLLELCKSLIEEYQFTKNKQVYAELKKRLEDINNWAEKEDSKKLLVEKNLLEAKIALINNDDKKAYQLMSEALLICERQNLKRFTEKISEISAKLETETKKERDAKSYQNGEEKGKIEPKMHIIGYKWDELGFFPFVEYGDLELSEISKQKYGTFVSIATSLGSEYRSGLFGPLPFAEHKDMESIVYAQMVIDKQTMDYRLENRNYLLVAIVYPRHIQKRFNMMREQIKKICSKMFTPDTDINKITTEHIIYFQSQLKELFY